MGRIKSHVLEWIDFFWHIYCHGKIYLKVIPSWHVVSYCCILGNDCHKGIMSN